MKTLPIQNADWGFWGTAKNIVKTDKGTKRAIYKDATAFFSIPLDGILHM